MPRQITFRVFLLGCLAAVLWAGVSTANAAPWDVNYRFAKPKAGPEAGRDRIRRIEKILNGQGCSAPRGASAVACSRYAMEASLIYRLVEGQGVESDNLLRRAYDLNPSCDLRILQATAIAKRAQRRQDLSGAATLFVGEGEKCDGTVARYYSAKLNILSDDEERVRTGRTQLDDLAGYGLGNSGIDPQDLLDLSVYSFVSTAEFDAAERQIREALGSGASVSPKLQALVLIGLGGKASFTIPAGNQAEAQQYLEHRVQDYRFGQVIEEFVDQAERLESVPVAPWEQIEERINADPNLTQGQRDVVRINFDDAFERLQEEIAQFGEAKAAIKAYGPDLAAAEQALVGTAVRSAFGDSGGNMDAAKQAYLETLQRLADSLEQINSVIVDMARIQDLHAMLVDPAAFQRLEAAVAEISARSVALTSDDADAVALRNFAKAVSQAIAPEEFFQAYEVSLDQLGFDSEKVVKNVRRVIELVGRQR